MKIKKIKIIVGKNVETSWWGNGLRYLKAAMNIEGVEQALIDGCEKFFTEEYSKVNLAHISEMRIKIKDFYQYNQNGSHKEADFTFSLEVEYDTDLGFNFYCPDAVAWMDKDTHKIREVTNNMLSRVFIDTAAEEVFDRMYVETLPTE